MVLNSPKVGTDVLWNGRAVVEMGQSGALGYHICWACEPIKIFWKSFGRESGKVLNCRLKFDSSLYLLLAILTHQKTYKGTFSKFDNIIFDFDCKTLEVRLCFREGGTRCIMLICNFSAIEKFYLGYMKAWYKFCAFLFPYTHYSKMCRGENGLLTCKRQQLFVLNMGVRKYI